MNLSTKRMRQVRTVWMRFQAGVWLGLGLLLLLVEGRVCCAADLWAFQVGGVTMSLEEITDLVDVRYQSLRTNRVLAFWNVEVTLNNKSDQALSGPFLLLSDSLALPKGSWTVDGTNGTNLLLDLTPEMPGSLFAPTEISAPRTLALVAAKADVRIFAQPRRREATALAFTRTLDENGQPLPGIGVVEIGPAGSTNFTSDPRQGFVTLGHQPGAYLWKFTGTDRLTVWRQQVLPSNDVVLLPDPRLTSRAAQAVEIAPLQGGKFSADAGRVSASFAGNAFAQTGVGYLTPLNAQSLPGLLPAGWSPLQAFWMELSVEPAVPGQVDLIPRGFIALNESIALAKWNEGTVQWEVLADGLVGNGTNVLTTTLPGSGVYVLVVPDAGVLRPPAAVQGTPLAPSQTGSPSTTALTAGGIVDPPSKPASVIGEMVTASATVTITNASGPQPSGLILSAEVTEAYRMRDGTRRVTPGYEKNIVAYQRPGDNADSTVTATFPLRPLLLLGGETLQEATIRVDVLAPSRFSGGIFGTNGGQLAAGNIRLSATVGDISSLQAAVLREISSSNFVGLAIGSNAVVQAFELGIGAITRPLTPQFSRQSSNSLFVLARVVAHQGVYGFEPVQRFTSDVSGALSSIEPLAEPRLPGVNEAGQYLLIRVVTPQALISGIARDAAGHATAGLSVRADPWMTLSKQDGAYALLTPTGSVVVAVSDVASGDAGQTSLAVSDTAPRTVDVGIQASGPRVIDVIPQTNATAVARTSPILITFDRPINPATLTSNDVQLLASNDGPLNVGISLNLAGTVVTLVPASGQLGANTLYTLTLSTNVADRRGRPLAGPRAFAFTTETDVLQRTAGRVECTEPDTNGLAIIIGSAGISEPGRPVVLVNETTGFTSTRLANQDGSVSDTIPAAVDDFLSLVLDNGNGTRTTIPVSKQYFNDGSIGLFNGGGTLEATNEDGQVQIIVAPGSIASKTKFKFEALTLGAILGLLSNTPPVIESATGTNAARILGGFSYTRSGDELAQRAELSFPVQPDALELTNGAAAANAHFALTIVHTNDGIVAYQVIDTMELEGNRLVTHSPPFTGLLGEFENALLAPILLPVGHVGVSGRVRTVQINDNGDTVANTERPVPGALVTATPDGALSEAPSHLRNGMLYALAGPNGDYSFLVPAPPQTTIAIRATHPAFPGVSANRFVTFPSGAADFAFLSLLASADLVFRSTAPFAGDLLAPALTLVHTPSRLDPGGTNLLKVIAIDDISQPKISVDVDSVISLQPDPNPPVTKADVTLTRVGQTNTSAVSLEASYAITAGRPLRVVLTISAVDLVGNENHRAYAVSFGGAEVTGTNAFANSDPNDRRGPMAIASIPSQGQRAFPIGEPILVTFNEPINPSVLKDPDAIVLTPDASPPFIGLSDDQTTLRLTFFDLQPGKDYTLTLGAGIKDLSTNRLDQDPTLQGDQDFSLSFTTAPLLSAALPGVDIGGGAVTRGIYAYVLERRGALNGAINVYDLSDPAAPSKVAELALPGFPRDLTLVPNYSYKRQLDGPSYTNDLLAVVGGAVGGAFGQYLQIIDISKPRLPQRIAGAQIEVSPSAAAVKVSWSPPRLAYVSINSDPAVGSTIGILNLQALILRELLTAGQSFSEDQWPFFGKCGKDANGDGDYVDKAAGDFKDDELPLPARAAGQIGASEGPAILPDTDQSITDLAFGQGGGYIGVIVEEGHLLDAKKTPVPAAYRTLYKSARTNYCIGSPPITLSRTNASFVFDKGRPRRVTALFDVPLVITNQLSIVDIALVSVNGENGGSNRLAVLDITEPTNIVLRGEIEIPLANGNSLYSVQRREDGLLALATSKDIVLIDPSRLLAKTNGFSIHPAIVGVIPNAGSGARSFAAGLSGLNIVSLGGKNLLLRSAPSLEFISFPTNQPFHPKEVLGTNDAGLARLLDGSEIAQHLALARWQAETGYVQSSLQSVRRRESLDPAVHYYVLLRAPGSAGPTSNIALESLNWAGAPLKKHGFLFPPVHCLSANTLNNTGQTPRDEDAPVRSCTAWRLSTNQASAFYNVYLSRPFALVAESLSKDDLSDIDTTLERDILWSGSYLRASIDASEADNRAVGPFAGRVATNRYTPGIEIVAQSLPADYLQSPNPMPIAGGSMIELTGSTVAAHNSELIVNTVDLQLPGRRLPIVFRRTYAGQALFDGPFGRGWDFNYDQRLVELSPELLRTGFTNPVVVRQRIEDSEYATNKDLLFYGGAGRVVVYKYAGTNAPLGVTNDPLAMRLGWVPSNSTPNFSTNVAAYYLPPPGLFSPLFKFKDGRYAQLDPDGTQTWFNHAGRLSKVYDRFETNALELIYNDQGDLIRIINDGGMPGTGSFWLDLGYYRNPGESMRSGVDTNATKAFMAGKVASLKDFTGRTVLFAYKEDGTLESRQTPEVTTVADEDGVKGRQTTRYSYTDASQRTRSAKSLIGVRGPNKGQNDVGGVESLLVKDYGHVGRDTVEMLLLAGREIDLQQAHPNTAQAVSMGNGALRIFSVASDAPRTTVEYEFDAFGRALKTKVSGETESGPASTSPLTTQFAYNSNGLPILITYPEENITRLDYEDTPEHLRSGANVITTTRDPGPRQGGVLMTKQHYDPYYNLLGGEQFDAKNQRSVITLTNGARSIVSIEKGGEVERFKYNEFGQLEVHTNYLGIIKALAYTTNGFLESQTVGAAGQTIVTSWAYDGPSGLRGLASSVTDPSSIITSNAFDELERPVSRTRAGAANSFCYDGAGNLCKQLTAVEAGRPSRVERFTYNNFGARESDTVEAVNVDQATAALRTDYKLDGYFRVKKVLPPSGETIEFTYDFAGRQVRSQVLKAEVVASQEDSTYDRNGNRTLSQIATATNLFRFDGHDRLIEVTNAAGARIVRAYDDNNNLTNTTTFDPSDGNKILAANHSEYDELDRPVKMVVDTDSGPATTTISYDSHARQTLMVGPTGETNTVTLDDKGRLARTANPAEALDMSYDVPGRKVTRTVTDGVGSSPDTSHFTEHDHMDKHTDARNQSHTFTRGFDGRVLSATTPENGTYNNQFTILGEPTSMSRPEGQTLLTRYDERRDVTKEFPANPGKGMTYGYDQVGRPTQELAADDVGSAAFNFNGFQLPTVERLARGFDVQNTYDLSGWLVARTITSLAPSHRVDTWGYDRLNRLTGATNLFGTVAYRYDVQGYAKAVQFEELGATWTITNKADGVGARTNVIYSDGLSIAISRDSSSRIQSMRPAGLDPVIKSAIYTAGMRVGERVLGNDAIKAQFLYDENRRPLARMFFRASDTNLLAGVRYTYDGSGMQIAREYLHRGGRADFFTYDLSHKLKRADLGARRSFSNETPRTVSGFSVPPGVDGKWSSGYFAREFTYSTAEVLTSATLRDPDSLATSPFPKTFAGVDVTLFVTNIDGVLRERDAAGNVTKGQVWVRIPPNPVPTNIPARFIYNELDQLTLIVRNDGVTISNVYGPTGLRIQRRVDGPPDRCVTNNYEYIYDGINLIEIRDLARPDHGLIARFYYGDDGDELLAGDLYDGNTDSLKRFYYLTDSIGSIMALADQDGKVVERSAFDAWGDGTIEPPDDAPPRVVLVTRETNDLIIEFSEAVHPTTNLVNSSGVPVEPIQVLLGNTPVPGTNRFEESSPGRAFGTTFRFTPSGSLGTGMVVVVNAGTLQDSSGNRNSNERLQLNVADNYAVIPRPVTSGAPFPRSSVASPFAFQGQIYDEDSGLIYLRARFYDAAGGLYLQRDPVGYKDSVNQYAAFANSPSSRRDPTGTKVETDDFLLSLAKVSQNAYEGKANGAQVADAVGQLAIAYLKDESFRNKLKTLLPNPGFRATAEEVLSKGLFARRRIESMTKGGAKAITGALLVFDAVDAIQEGVEKGDWAGLGSLGVARTGTGDLFTALFVEAPWKGLSDKAVTDRLQKAASGLTETATVGLLASANAVIGAYYDSKGTDKEQRFTLDQDVAWQFWSTAPADWLGEAVYRAKRSTAATNTSKAGGALPSPRPTPNPVDTK